MNITLIGTAFPLRGGIAHYNALLARALAERHEVQTITFSRQYPSLLFPGKTQEESPGTEEATPAPRLIDSINPVNWLRVGNLIRKQAPDLLLFKYWLPFFGPCFGTIARRARSNGHTRVICICDNVLPHERRPGDIAFTRYAFHSVDGFIVQSDAVEKELKDFWKDARYRNVPHPVYTMFGEAIDKAQARKALGITAPRVLLFFGYVRKYKGLDILLDALARLPRDMGLHVVVAGEFYDPERGYRDLIRTLQIEDRVTLRSDYLPNEDVRTYFSAADAVVLPYRSATQSGIAQIAYNFDTPVIATDVGGLSEVVLNDRTGLIVPPGDPDALADAITRFYTSGREPMYRKHIQQGKSKYSWQNLVHTIEELAASIRT
jgi:glycosyltransferase involved in cell wall biosynthesis